eukprot:4800038-Lingulodinium_polyedra.AAC.1
MDGHPALMQAAKRNNAERSNVLPISTCNCSVAFKPGMPQGLTRDLRRLGPSPLPLAALQVSHGGPMTRPTALL